MHGVERSRLYGLGRCAVVATPALVALFACGHSGLAPVVTAGASSAATAAEEAKVAVPSPPIPAKTPRPSPARVPRYRVPIYHRVRPDETLYAIAWRYGLDYRRVASLNDIGPPYVIYVGQRLRLQQVPTQPVQRRAEAAPPRPAAKPARGAPRSTPAADHRPQGRSGAAQIEASTTASPPPKDRPTPRPSRKKAGIEWSWPTQGSVLSSFIDGDDARNGLDIGGRLGQPVRTAADGEVVYSGNGLIGYGNLVIVKHNADYLSAYGHNRTVRVREGDRVRRGDALAEMGRRPGGEPSLHFEIRRDGRPVDPMTFLPPP